MKENVFIVSSLCMWASNFKKHNLESPYKNDFNMAKTLILKMIYPQNE